MPRQRERLTRDAIIAELELRLNQTFPQSSFYWYLGEAGISPNRNGYTRDQLKKLLAVVSKKRRRK